MGGTGTDASGVCYALGVLMFSSVWLTAAKLEAWEGGRLCCRIAVPAEGQRLGKRRKEQYPADKKRQGTRVPTLTEI